MSSRMPKTVSIVFCLVFFSVFSLSLLPSVKADDFIIQDPFISIDPIGGQSITKDITFQYVGSASRHLSIITTVVPDDGGINISFSNVPSTVSPNSFYTVQIHIVTSFYIAPDDYSIYVDFSTAAIPAGSPSRVVIQHTTSTNPVNNTVPETPEINPITPDDTPYIPPPTGAVKQSNVNYFIPLVIFFLCIALLLFLYRRRKKSKEVEENGKIKQPGTGG